MAAESGNTQAQQRLGLLLDDHRGDDEEAERWWRMAAEGGETYAQFSMGRRSYHRGDKDDAEHWWRMATEAGLPEAQDNLEYLLDQRGDHAEAGRWFRRAAEGDNRNDEALSCVPHILPPSVGTCAGAVSKTSPYEGSIR